MSGPVPGHISHIYPSLILVPYIPRITLLVFVLHKKAMSVEAFLNVAGSINDLLQVLLNRSSKAGLHDDVNRPQVDKKTPS